MKRALDDKEGRYRDELQVSPICLSDADPHRLRQQLGDPANLPLALVWASRGYSVAGDHVPKPLDVDSLEELLSDCGQPRVLVLWMKYGGSRVAKRFVERWPSLTVMWICADAYVHSGRVRVAASCSLR